MCIRDRIIGKTVLGEVRQQQRHFVGKVTRQHKKTWRNMGPVLASSEPTYQRSHERRWSRNLGKRLLIKHWNFAGHVARMPEERWAARVARWRGTAWRDARRNSQGRLLRGFRQHVWRWDRGLEAFLKFKGWRPWPEVAENMPKEDRAAFGPEFASWLLAGGSSLPRQRGAPRPHSFSRLPEALELEQARLQSEAP